MGSHITEHMTRCVDAAGFGSRQELGEFVERLYDQVRHISASEMRQAFAVPIDSLTLQPTAIANDAIIRVLQQRSAVTDPDHFFALATHFIRQLIVDYRRHRMAEKRGRGRRGVSIEAAEIVSDDAVDDSAGNVLPVLQRLHAQYPRKAEVVTLHVICGHSLPKVAQMLDISRATAERDWAFAKVWLADALRPEEGA